MLTRRGFSTCLCASVFAPHASFAVGSGLAGFAAEVARVEAAIGGRLGCALIDTSTGARAGHRMDERFPLCSTFKVLAVPALLSRVDRGLERLDRRVSYEAADLVAYSPATTLHVAAGMTLAELCAAALTQSDNTAGNLILAAIGGPPAVTAFARSIGDGVTRLDRTETALNEATPSDPRDTTTPAAMAENLRVLTCDGKLSTTSRDCLVAWMDACATGATRLRAGLPKTWRIGDKTGAGDHGTTNDIAFVRPPGRAPFVLTAYLTQSAASAEDRYAAIAAIGRAAALAFG